MLLLEAAIRFRSRDRERDAHTRTSTSACMHAHACVMREACTLVACQYTLLPWVLGALDAFRGAMPLDPSNIEAANNAQQPVAFLQVPL